MKSTLFTFLILLFANLAHAEWKHINMTAADGTLIQLDYEVKEKRNEGCYKCSNYTYASPLWVSIKHNGLGPKDKVRIVLLNFNSHTAQPGSQFMDVKEMDLEYVEAGTFSKEIKNLPIFSTGYGGTEYYWQEIAVVINENQWLYNLVNRSNNFGFKL